MAADGMTLAEQAARVAQLVEAGRDDDLDALCAACEAAEQVVGALEARIRRLVEQQDHGELCRAPDSRAC